MTEAQSETTIEAQIESAHKLCTNCYQLQSHSTPVNTGHATTGESGCPDCLTATLRPVVHELGDERTINGGYITPSDRENAITLEDAIMYARHGHELQNQDDDDDTVEISVFASTYDPESEGFETARDIRASNDETLVDSQAFYEAYDLVAGGSIELDDAEDDEEIVAVVYKRLQGPRTDDELGYDGTQQRSISPSDIIAVNDTAYFIKSWTGPTSIGALADLH